MLKKGSMTVYKVRAGDIGDLHAKVLMEHDGLAVISCKTKVPKEIIVESKRFGPEVSVDRVCNQLLFGEDNSFDTAALIKMDTRSMRIASILEDFFELSPEKVDNLGLGIKKLLPELWTKNFQCRVTKSIVYPPFDIDYRDKKLFLVFGDNLYIEVEELKDIGFKTSLEVGNHRIIRVVKGNVVKTKVYSRGNDEILIDVRSIDGKSKIYKNDMRVLHADISRICNYKLKELGNILNKLNKKETV